MEVYYVIRCSVDGDVRVEELDKAELLDRLDDNIYGSGPVFLTDLEKIGKDPQSWPEHGMLIIKGKVVVPVEAKRVVEYTVE
jgi:hypothetical protein